MSSTRAPDDTAARPELASTGALLRAVEDGLQPDFLFFWGHTSHAEHVGKECLSQWYPASFVVDGVRFATAEHFMMWSKAKLFGDAEAADHILAASHPSDAKKLGRTVRNFDGAVWESRRFGIVVEGSRAKFSQSPALGAYLVGTKRRVLVEASPQDTIWGIGLAEGDAAARDPARWRGLNLLGFALMEARARLQGSA